jgi:hypothetical protein
MELEMIVHSKPTNPGIFFTNACTAAMRFALSAPARLKFMPVVELSFASIADGAP